MQLWNSTGTYTSKYKSLFILGRSFGFTKATQLVWSNHTSLIVQKEDMKADYLVLENHNYAKKTCKCARYIVYRFKNDILCFFFR